LSAPASTLAAGSTANRVRAETTLAAETKLLALWPEPGSGARSVEITATNPEGMMIPLLWIQEFRPHWRSPYLFSTPETLARGTRIVMTTYFDNPDDKPRVVRPEVRLLTTAASPR
jgi:hypothetical protein